jgi:hydrogenase small subunit
VTAGGNWVDVGAPFLDRHRVLPLPGFGPASPGSVAGVVGGAAAAALVLHGIGMAATGRTKGGADYEPMKESEAKKGGGK